MWSSSSVTAILAAYDGIRKRLISVFDFDSHFETTSSPCLFMDAPLSVGIGLVNRSTYIIGAILFWSCKDWFLIVIFMSWGVYYSVAFGTGSYMYAAPKKTPWARMTGSYFSGVGCWLYRRDQCFWVISTSNTITAVTAVTDNQLAITHIPRSCTSNSSHLIYLLDSGDRD